MEKLASQAVLGLRHDPELWIAEGSSRYESHWKNRHVLWSRLLARLRTATVTQETHAEYMAMPKARQDRIKDMGGFVGGVLRDGIRRADTVKSRSMISFDLDHAPRDFVDRMITDEPHAWAIYSTHKHTPEAPRLRMLFPLSREVSAEEYEAMSRKLAEHIGLQFFDGTTFQASRLMYWPSVSRGAEYVFEYNDGEPLNPDTVLAEYEDWHDISQWPTTPDEVRVRKKRAEKMQDPTKKEGPVGIFCRTYTVPEAIEAFLGDIYKPTRRDDRYTYAAGSTSGGLVIYDNGLFCYSNHATDPAHGKDLNAFDLVRIHIYGDEDEQAKEDTPVNRLPSYARMTELIGKDPECIKTADTERLRRASAAFAGDFTGDEMDEENGDDWQEWRGKLERNKRAEILATPGNLQIIMQEDKRLRGIRWNEMTKAIEITNRLPWDAQTGVWTNEDDSGLYVYLSLNYATFNRSDIADVLVRAAIGRKFHPIRQYLEGLPAWDGVKRGDTLLIDLLDAEDTPYVREVTHKWLLGAVSRAFNPGLKFDWCLTLTGEQSIGKSTLAAKLGGKWFSDALSFEDMRDEKAGAEKLRGEWIMEIGELKGLRKMDVESVKSFLSRTVDKYRPSYARRVESFPRGCVFMGTGNNQDFLRDPTGSRRFWPVNCRRKRDDPKRGAWDLTEEDVDQIWAEAYVWYKTGESVELSQEAKKAAEAAQEEATEQDERAGLVEEYLDTPLPDAWPGMDSDARRLWLSDRRNQDGHIPRAEVCVLEIWVECFRKPAADRRRSDSDDITRILKQVGWMPAGKSKRLPNYGKQKIFVRKDEA